MLRHPYLYQTVLLLSICMIGCVRHEDYDAEKSTHLEVKQIIKDPCYQTGKAIFDANCSACHGTNRYVVALPFQGIRKAYGLDWCITFIHDSQKMIASGDARANKIFKLHNQLLMTRFPQLDTMQINCILNYVDSYPILDSSYYTHYKE